MKYIETGVNNSNNGTIMYRDEKYINGRIHFFVKLKRHNLGDNLCVNTWQV